VLYLLKCERTVGSQLWNAFFEDALRPNLGSILQNLISAGNFSDKFSSSNFGQIYTQIQKILIDLSMKDNNLGF
jgi:hypothetical protein